ncbi:MAG TPA: flagellar filament capping protein FliD [Polyangiales bacterium]
MANPISGAGLGSNLDVTGLVAKLMAAEQGPLTQIQTKEAAVQVQITSFGTFRGALSSFQGTLSGLETAASYSASKASFGDPTVASANVSSGADAGSHTLEVTSLASAQRLKSGTAFNNITDNVGTGTLTINFGSYDSGTNAFTENDKRGAVTVAIDSAHSSLAGVRDAINAANVGVNASIVNDGTGNRLVLASSSTGTTNGLSISVADDDGNNTDASGLSQLAFDPTQAAGSGKNMTQVVAATDANFLLDGISISKQSNTVTDVLAGTTLNLLKTNAGSPTTLNITQDTSQVTSAVNAFVQGYNALNKSVQQLTAYDTSTSTPTAGPLLGDATVRSMTEQIKSKLGQIVSGVNGGYKALAQIGITSDSSGNLQVDSDKLQQALTSNPGAVQALFATSGSTDDPLVTYNASSATTPAGLYSLNVSQLATQGKTVGSSAAGLTIDSTNDALTVAINGVTTSVTLNHGTYANADALATELQSQLNGSAALSSANISTTVSNTNGVLTLTSNQYGSTSTVSLAGGNAQSNLFGSGATQTDGLDVAGTIGGVTAVGSGQSLLGTNGLSLTINGGTTGDRGNIHYTQGVAVQLDSMLSNFLGTNGVLASRTNSLNAQVTELDKETADENAALAAKQAAYTQQFTTLDQLITTMNSTMSYLTQQLSSLNSSTSSK